MNQTEAPSLSAREIAGDLLRYMTVKQVKWETLQEAIRLVASEFEEEE